MTDEPRRAPDETVQVDRNTLEPLLGGLPREAVRSEPGADAKGWRVGHYTVERELGRGGMGIVHLAYDEELRRHVALKVLPRGLAARGDARRRFLREARSMARVRDARVVGILEVLESEQALALALDYIDGCTLADLLMALKSAPDAAGREPDLATVAQVVGCSVEDLGSHERYAQWVAQLGVEIAGALQSVHDSKVLHRDVKPSNVLLDRRGQPHLSDFGVAVDPEATVITQGDVICGTAQYASPEQLRGSEDLDGRTDVYGLGALLYELLTMGPPASGSPATILERIETRSVPRLGPKVAPWVPADLAKVVHKAMDPERELRYSTPAQLAADLQAFRMGLPVTARPLGRLGRAWRWMRREPARLAAAVLLVGLTGLGGWLAVELPRARAARLAEVQAQVSESIASGFLLIRDDVLRARSLDSFEEALRRDPDSALALAGLAIARATLGDLDGARRELEARPQLLGKHRALRDLLDIEGELYRRSPGQDLAVSQESREPLELFVAALSILRRTTVKDHPDEYKTAVAMLRSALELSVAGGATEHLHGELILALAGLDDEEEVRRASDTLASLHGDSWVTHLRIALALDEFDGPAAIAAVERARVLRADPVAADLLTARIQAGNEGLGGREAALATLERAVESHRDAPELAGALAQMLLTGESRDERVQELLLRSEESLRQRQASSDDDALHLHLAVRLSELQQQLGRQETARETLEAAIARQSGSWSLEAAFAMFEAGTLLRDHSKLRTKIFRDHARLGERTRDEHREEIDALRARVERVTGHFEAAFDSAPYHKLTARNLGVLRIRQTAELEAALPVVRRVHELEPNEPDHLVMLGMVLNKLGRETEALEVLERAGEIVKERGFPPSNTTRARGLLETARARMRLGQYAEAHGLLETSEAEKLLTSRRERSTVLALHGLVHALDDDLRDDEESTLKIRQALRMNGNAYPLAPRIAAEHAIALGRLDAAATHLERAVGIAERFILCEPIETQRELMRADLEVIRARQAEVEAARESGVVLTASVPR